MNIIRIRIRLKNIIRPNTVKDVSIIFVNTNIIYILITSSLSLSIPNKVEAEKQRAVVELLSPLIIVKSSLLPT